MKKSLYNEKYFKNRDFLDPKIAKCVHQLAIDHKLKTILDVGCGTGLLVNFLRKKGLKAIGCDPYAKLPKKKYFLKANATKLPFANISFDLITAISLLEHLTEKENKAFLLESRRVLRSGGYLFIVTPNFNSIWRRILRKRWYAYSDPTHVNFFTPASLTSDLKKSGFTNFAFQFPSKNLSFLDNLLVSTPFWRLRDSFYMAAKK